MSSGFGRLASSLVRVLVAGGHCLRSILERRRTFLAAVADNVPVLAHDRGAGKISLH